MAPEPRYHKLTLHHKPTLLHNRPLALLERPGDCMCLVTSQANITSQGIIAPQAPAGTARTTLCFDLLSFTSQASITSQAHGEGQQVTQICVACCLASPPTSSVILLLLHALSQAFISFTIMRPQSWQWHRTRGLHRYVVSLRHRAGDLASGSSEVS